MGSNLTNCQYHQIPGAPGDLNFDGMANTLDIDLLREAIAVISTDMQFDLNGDTFINGTDVTFLLTNLLDTLIAEVTLDKVVDAEDLAIIRANMSTTSTAILPWSQGNLVSDGIIDEIDVQAARFHFGFENLPAAPPVPEPATALFFLGACWATRRQFRTHLLCSIPVTALRPELGTRDRDVRSTMLAAIGT